MQMTRTFHAVGKGVFCTECFEDGCSIVYGCGTLDGQSRLHQEIDSQFPQGGEIEAVFILRLHPAHCSGLEYLLKRCRVKRLFLPFLRNADKACALSEGGMCEDKKDAADFLLALLEDAQGAAERMGKETKVVYVLPQEARDGDMPSVPGCHTVESGTQILLECQQSWIFTPFYFGGDDKENDRAALYSGPANIVEESDAWAYGMASGQKEYAQEIEAGCLYVGEHEKAAEGKEILSCPALWPYRCRIGCLQSLRHDGESGEVYVVDGFDRW